MTEEYIYERERDMLDYFRNNTEDPSSRGTSVIESHTAIADQTDFELTNTLVKNVADTITINGVLKYKGYDYHIEYGEGTDKTKLILNTAAKEDDVLLIGYHYGPSMIEREFSRSDAQLPRVIIMFLTGSSEAAALGDGINEGKGTYFNASYRFEIRDKFANRARILASKIFNLGQKMRHRDLFRTNITESVDLQNFDYDPEKDCYIWQFTLRVQWEINFE